MVQLFGHPSAPWPWDRARALWTAFGIFMPFVFDLSLAKAKENDSDLSLSLSLFFFFSIRRGLLECLGIMIEYHWMSLQ